MLLAGDEFGRQGGNNNAYCQDNEISWLNWDIKEKGHCLIAFAQKVIGLRCKYPILRRDRYLDGEYVEELNVKDVTWINANGKEMEDKHWGDSGARVVSECCWTAALNPAESASPAVRLLCSLSSMVIPTW